MKKKRKKNKVSKVNSVSKDEVTVNDVVNKTESNDTMINNDESVNNEEKDDIPMVDLEKTIFVKDLNPVIDENVTAENDDTKKKTIDIE